MRESIWQSILADRSSGRERTLLSLRENRIREIKNKRPAGFSWKNQKL
jgi:hypothetical protein